MTNMSDLLKRLPRLFNQVRDMRFQATKERNADIIIHQTNTRNSSSSSSTPSPSSSSSEKLHQMEHLLRDTMATASCLSSMAKKQYPEYPIIQTLADELAEQVCKHRSNLDHTFVFNVQQQQHTRSLESMFSDCIHGLTQKETQEFQERTALHMAKMEYLLNTQIDCAVFAHALDHLLDTLLNMEVQSRVDARYIRFFLDVIGQLLHTRYPSCISKQIQRQFYILHQKV